MAGRPYIADPPDLVRTADLGGLTALFHLPSGMTHIVAPPAPQILAALTDGPADLAALWARLSAAFDMEGGEAALIARLDELEAAGLVRPA